MEDYRLLKDLSVRIDRDQVLRQIDCYEDSPVYEQVLEEYEDHIEELKALAEPCGIIGITNLPEDIRARGESPCAPVIYSVVSVGNALKDRSTQAFAAGDYVLGMMIDAVADSALFSLEEGMIRQLRAFCKEHHVGIRRRIEAPYDIPMKVQKAAHDFLKTEERLGIGITTGYMFDPVKTACQVFILSDNEREFQAVHDCRHCPNLTCKQRHIPPCVVRAEQGGKEWIFQLIEGESLMKALIREGFRFSAACGGKGRCGKCGVRILEGTVPETDADRAFYTEDQRKQGWRLACMAHPKGEIRIQLDWNDESNFEILGAGGGAPESTASADRNTVAGDSPASVVSPAPAGTAAADHTAGPFDIAVDIGTTTVAMALVRREDHEVLSTAACVNSQRIYGADVITRIKASTDGKKKELQRLIRENLSDGIKKLLTEAGVPMDRIGKIVISGNTTMGHLLMGYDCDTLGVYPFTPVNIDFIKGSAREIILGEPGCSANALTGRPADETAAGPGNGLPAGPENGPAAGSQNSLPTDPEVTILPGISTFVGGDITAGLLACGFDRNEEICMLIDLGTNGEMALGNKDRILVTSTAAGPAFEGGNISQGCGSIPGAVCHVEINGTDVQVRTIKDRPPVGICGTGVLETTAELLKEEWVDASGMMDEEYFDEGFPVAEKEDGTKILFTQQDVREIQLAKAAVRAGMETLILRYGAPREAISRIYLAGGFGFKLDTEKAIAIGMLPEDFRGRIEAVGNSALAGALQYLKDEDAKERMKKIISVSEEIGLSMDEDFNELYMNSMMFGDE